MKKSKKKRKHYKEIKSTISWHTIPCNNMVLSYLVELEKIQLSTQEEVRKIKKYNSVLMNIQKRHMSEIVTMDDILDTIALSENSFYREQMFPTTEYDIQLRLQLVNFLIAIINLGVEHINEFRNRITSSLKFKSVLIDNFAITSIQYEIEKFEKIVLIKKVTWEIFNNVNKVTRPCKICVFLPDILFQLLGFGTLENRTKIFQECFNSVRRLELLRFFTLIRLEIQIEKIIPKLQGKEKENYSKFMKKINKNLYTARAFSSWKIGMFINLRPCSCSFTFYETRILQVTFRYYLEVIDELRSYTFEVYPKLEKAETLKLLKIADSETRLFGRRTYFALDMLILPFLGRHPIKFLQNIKKVTKIMIFHLMKLLDEKEYLQIVESILILEDTVNMQLTNFKMNHLIGISIWKYHVESQLCWHREHDFITATKVFPTTYKQLPSLL